MCRMETRHFGLEAIEGRKVNIYACYASMQEINEGFAGGTLSVNAM